jgi:osmotically-inducible protein OsmY
VINTGSFSAEETLALVAGMVHSGALEPSALDRQRLANLALASRVEATLFCDPTVWVSGLRVVAQQGRMRIEGEVVAEHDRNVVEELVQRIDGVQLIDNDLRIQPPPLIGM